MIVEAEFTEGESFDLETDTLVTFFKGETKKVKLRFLNVRPADREKYCLVFPSDGDRITLSIHERVLVSGNSPYIVKCLYVDETTLGLEFLNIAQRMRRDGKNG